MTSTPEADVWQAYPLELVKDAPEATTSAWQHISGGIVGVMRPNILSVPFLWFQLDAVSFDFLRTANEAVDQLHQLLHTPTFWANADEKLSQSERFLAFLKFTPFYTGSGVIVYERSI